MLPTRERMRLASVVALAIILSLVLVNAAPGWGAIRASSAASSGLSRVDSGFIYDGAPLHLTGISGAYSLVSNSSYDHQQFVDTITSPGSSGAYGAMSYDGVPQY